MDKVQRQHRIPKDIQADRDEGNQYIAALQRLAGRENCALVLTMRADFYLELMNSDGAK